MAKPSLMENYSYKYFPALFNLSIFSCNIAHNSKTSTIYWVKQEVELCKINLVNFAGMPMPISPLQSSVSVFHSFLSHVLCMLTSHNLSEKSKY